MADDDYTPPPRSLLWAAPYAGEDGEQGIELGCDCGRSTVYVIEDAGRITEAREVAFTCDGCSSVRWVTVRPSGQPLPEAT